MGLLDKLKGTVGSDDQTYHYRCPDCETTFESPHADMSKVECPDCSVANVLSVPSSQV